MKVVPDDGEVFIGISIEEERLIIQRQRVERLRAGLKQRSAPLIARNPLERGE